jgi:drug/metabolite transporter (DMT)-like permease
MRTNSDHERPDRVALGIGLVLLSTLFTSLAEVIFRHISGDGTVWQYFFWRSLLSVPVLLAIAFVWGDGAATVLQVLRPWPIVRSLLFVLMFITVYAALPFIPLATLAAGLYTSPLFVAALSPLVSGELVSSRGWIAIALGFSGVLLILQPGTDSFTWLAMLPVAGGLCYALSALVTRSKCRAVPPATLGVSMNLALVATSAIVSIALMALEPSARTVALSLFLFGS